jgi:hypothetical protein
MPANHFHSTFEIFYLISGKREFFIKDRTFVINEGDFVIISPNILHRTTNTEIPKHERLIVNIHETCMTVWNPSYRNILQPLFEQEYFIVRYPQHEHLLLDTLSETIIQEIQEKRPGYEMYALTLVLQMLIICYRNIKQSSFEQIESPSPMHVRTNVEFNFRRRYITLRRKIYARIINWSNGSHW